ANAIVEAGHDLDKRQVNMDKSIKTLGLFPIRVSLHAEVDAIVTVNVARSLEEAETQARTGEAVVANADGDLKEAPQAIVASNVEEEDHGASASINESEEIKTEKADEGDGELTAS
ncbi:MAG: 50S ribosomal L9 C-terminal domain-containing protein, partial [Candidatus Puniceispirillaceae bacterium]